MNMKQKRLLSFFLALCLVIAGIPATVCAAEPTWEELSDIYWKAVYDFAYFNGGFYQSGENAPDDLVFWYLSYIDAFDPYFDEAKWCVTIPYDTFISLADQHFTHHSDMKKYLSYGFIYDEENGIISWTPGGEGGCYECPMLTVYQSGSTYYLQGLVLDLDLWDTTGLVENVDYVMRNNIYDGTPYAARIAARVEVAVVKTAEGLKVDARTQMDYHIIDGVLYTSEAEKYYPVTITYYDYNEKTGTAAAVAQNGASLMVFDGMSLENNLSKFPHNNSLWRPATDAVMFTLELESGYSLKKITYQDASGSGDFQLLFGSYHHIPDGPLTIGVYTVKEAAPEPPTEATEPTESVKPAESVKPTETENPEEPSAAVEPTEYKVIEGADGEWTSGSGDALTVRVDGDYSKFLAVYVDDALVEESSYTVTEGSTIVTFSPDYLSTLPAGEHIMTVAFTDGAAVTMFTVKSDSEQSTVPSAAETVPETADTAGPGVQTDPVEEEALDEGGGNGGLIALIVIAVIVLAGAGGTAYYFLFFRKRKVQ